MIKDIRYVWRTDALTLKPKKVLQKLIVNAPTDATGFQETKEWLDVEVE